MGDIYENIDDIIEGCILKNEKDIELLYKKYFGYSLNVALLYVKNRSDAIEIVDDAFLKVLKEIKSYIREFPFRFWLRRIVINTAIDSIRRRKRWVFWESADEINESTCAVEDPLDNSAANDILKIVNLLPQIQRAVFCLFEIEGFTHKEIAKKMHIAESSSRVYLTRAKERLRDLYDRHFNQNSISDNN